MNALTTLFTCNFTKTIQICLVSMKDGMKDIQEVVEIKAATEADIDQVNYLKTMKPLSTN